MEDGGLYRCEVATAGCGNRYSTEISINSKTHTVHFMIGLSLIAIQPVKEREERYILHIVPTCKNFVDGLKQ